ncbi:MAG TPA: hypothetical protein PKC48_11180, partial [Sphingorhabdus sp.]|nr:hypothetical protein [Sphingorhabdus sp.]
AQAAAAGADCALLIQGFPMLERGGAKRRGFESVDRDVPYLWRLCSLQTHAYGEGDVRRSFPRGAHVHYANLSTPSVTL